MVLTAAAPESPALASLLAAGNLTLTPAQSAVLASRLLAGVTLTGYDDRSPVGVLSPAQEREAQASALLAPVFSYVVADGPDLAAQPGAYAFTSIATACGFDPRASASSSPSTSASGTPSASATASMTPEPTPSNSATSSVSPTSAATGSGTPSATRTASGTATRTASRTSSSSGTPSPTGTPLQALPAAYRDASVVMTAEQAEVAGAVASTSSGGAAAVGNNTSGDVALSYDWRTDATLVSLDGAPDSDFQFSTHSLTLAWEPFVDVGSGVASVAYCLGSAQFRCDLHRWTSAVGVKASVDYAVLTNLSIAPGTVVFATVAAVNHVGLVSMASSDGVLLDDRPPAIDRVVDTGKYFLQPDAAPGAGTVVYRPPVDIDCDAEGAGVGAVWRESAAPAGIGYYEWAVGTAPNATDILAFTNVGTSVAVFNETLRVPAGTTFFTTVRSVRANGLIATRSSDGVRVVGAVDADARMLCFAPAAQHLQQ